MKIVSYELVKVPPSWVWIKIHTDEGITGLGEPFLEGHADVVCAEVTRLMPLLIGEDCSRISFIWDRLYNAGNGYRGGPVKMSALSGIDMALWDIAGKAHGVPVYKLLGGMFHDRIKVYCGSNGYIPATVVPGMPGTSIKVIPDARPRPAKVYDEAKILVDEWGFRCLKLHVAFSETIKTDVYVKEAVECVAALREAVGYKADIAIDVHCPHPNYTRQIAREIEPYRPLFMEEPVPMERIGELRNIVNYTTVPVAAGELWMGKWAFHEALQAGASVLQPDMTHAGGITELYKIASMAQVFHAVMAPHCPTSPLSFAACVQLGAAIKNFLVLEHNEINSSRVNGQTVFGYGYFADPFVLDGDGCVAVPDKPGLGVELNEAGMADIMNKPWSYVRG